MADGRVGSSSTRPRPNRFAMSSPYACDCDTSTGPGACDIFDFLCFQNAYDAGCP